MKNQTASAALVILGLACHSFGALGDKPQLVSATARRTVTGFTFTAKWIPNDNSTDGVRPKFTVRPNDAFDMEVPGTKPAVIRGVKPVTVTAKITGLTRGTPYAWRAIAGGDRNGITTEIQNTVLASELATAGTYEGVTTDDNGTPRGLCTVTLSKAGSISGSLYAKGMKVTLGGAFDTAGVLTLKRTTHSGDVFDITLTSDVINNTLDVQLDVPSQGISWTFTLGRRNTAFSKLNPAPQAGQYSFLFPRDPAGAGNPNFPEGDSFANFNVSPKGILTGIVYDAGGFKFSVGYYLNDYNEASIYNRLQSPAGAPDPSYFAASLYFPPLGNDPDGLWAWRRARNSKAPLFRAGFETNFNATGERYAATDFAPLFGQTLSFSFAGGNLIVPLFRDVTVTPQGKVLDLTEAGDSLKLSFNRKTLMFSGSFVPGNFANPPEFKSSKVVFRAFPNYGGSFYGPTFSGRLEF